MTFKLLANTPMGLERVVASEIESLGYETTLENGRVFFEGDSEAIIRTNLMMRTADRIRIIIGDFCGETIGRPFQQHKSAPLAGPPRPGGRIPRTWGFPKTAPLPSSG